MKKILFTFLMTIAVMFTQAQVVRQTSEFIHPDSAGMIEKMPVFEAVVADTLIDDTDTIYSYDTVYLNGFYDYHAVANPGYKFEYWEVITHYSGQYHFEDSVWYDTLAYSDTLVDSNEYLEWDMGIPDLGDSAAWEYLDSNLLSIEVHAYFTPDTNVGIKDVMIDTYTIYPNPTTGIININGDVRSVNLYDVNGRIVESTPESTINLKGYPNGIYLLKITSSSGTITTRRVVKK